MKTLRTAAVALVTAALVAGGATSATAGVGDDLALSALELRDTATYGSIAAVNGSFTGPLDVLFSSFTATVVVNGVPVADNVSIAAGKGLIYQRSWGAGVASLTNLRASGLDDRDGSITNREFTDKPVAVPAHSFRVRYAVDYKRSKIGVVRKGKKLTFTLKARYLDRNNRAVGLRQATLQVRRSGKWKTVKHVRLNRSGIGTYRMSSTTRRTYRMLVKTTDLVRGDTSFGTRPI